MRTARVLVSALIGVLAIMTASVWAAPVESVESGRATAAQAKIDAFLGEQLVAQQLAVLGLSPDQARARVAQLSEAQLEQVAAQIDLLQAGGTIEGGNPHPWATLECLMKPLGRLFYNIYHMMFCWGDLR